LAGKKVSVLETVGREVICGCKHIFPKEHPYAIEQKEKAHACTTNPDHCPGVEPPCAAAGAGGPILLAMDARKACAGPTQGFWGGRGANTFQVDVRHTAFSEAQEEGGGAFLIEAQQGRTPTTIPLRLAAGGDRSRTLLAWLKADGPGGGAQPALELRVSAAPPGTGHHHTHPAGRAAALAFDASVAGWGLHAIRVALNGIGPGGYCPAFPDRSPELVTIVPPKNTSGAAASYWVGQLQVRRGHLSDAALALLHNETCRRYGACVSGPAVADVLVDCGMDGSVHAQLPVVISGDLG
jgi:hypothetical protein